MAQSHMQVPTKPRPVDPMELMKQGGRAAGTPVVSAPVANAPPAEPVVTLEAHEEVVLPPPPALPPPPLVPPEEYRVLEDKIVLLNRCRLSTTVRKGQRVSNESHDLADLRHQGVKMERVDAA